LECFQLGHVAKHVHEKAAYIRGVQLVTVQIGPSPGTECHLKSFVFYKLLHIFVAYQIRTALKMTKSWSQDPCNEGYEGASTYLHIGSHKVSLTVSVLSLRRARFNLPHALSYPALPSLHCHKSLTTALYTPC